MNEGIIYLTRRMTFSAAHRLHDFQLSAEENIQIYGKCNNRAGHGHNYVLEVTLRGKANPRTGMLINLVDLKNILEELIISRVDHHNLNEDVDFLQKINPTAENLIVKFWEELVGAFPAGLLYEIKLTETENNYVIYKGEQGE